MGILRSGRLVGVLLLSLCLILAGCGYTPTKDPTQATASRIASSAAFKSAAAELDAQGISVDAESVFLVDAEKGTALFRASEPGVFVYARFDGAKVLSASIMSFTGDDWYVHNALFDVRAEGTFAELESLSNLDPNSLDAAVLPASVSGVGMQLVAALGYGDIGASKGLLEPQCAACDSERNSRNLAAAGAALAATSLALAIAALSSCVAPVACPVAIAAYFAADAAMGVAAAAYVDAQTNLDRCIREKC